MLATGKNTEPKAVIFVPYTPNSELAKELRKVEENMLALSGMRLKIVEKAGIQLKNILVKTNPWAGMDCQREGCLPCSTRAETGEGKGKACYKRNVIYETWCGSCKDRDEEEAVEEGLDPAGIKIYKYIGESSRSSFARGKNHLDDARLLSSGSHMLKHYLDRHLGERMEDMVFRMKVLHFKRSAFERQVHESVIIQQTRSHHHLLNSRSEFNRCSIPRLTVKLGEKEMGDMANTLRQEQKKEDDIERVIRDMKRKSKKRAFDRIDDLHPLPKRQKRDKEPGAFVDDTKHDDLVDIALDTAISLCDISTHAAHSPERVSDRKDDLLAEPTLTGNHDGRLSSNRDTLLVRLCPTTTGPVARYVGIHDNLDNGKILTSCTPGTVRENDDPEGEVLMTGQVEQSDPDNGPGMTKKQPPCTS